MDESRKYTLLCLMTKQQLSDKEIKQLIKEGYLEADKPLRKTKRREKAETFIKDFEKPLIEKVKLAFKDKKVLSKAELKKIANISKSAYISFEQRLCDFHEIIGVDSDGDYFLRS